MNMLDGNTAALHAYEAEQDDAERVYEAHEATARAELTDEAIEKFVASDVTLDEVFDEASATRWHNDIELALSRDQDAEVGAMFRAIRQEILNRRRAAWVEDELDSRVWALNHNHSED